ncbi:MAG TPA: radical SAM family heme chaperone HemW [Thermodesulfobacteriaceae bacterium]|nr:radical SAM family heme chaperone HemW [Thermodesulfobacteriaceae bacterium]
MAGMYIHIPFCTKKCPYCDFVSGPASPETKKRYLHAVRQEMLLAAERPMLSGLHFGSIFIGGGTPTTVQAEEIISLVDTALETFLFSGTPEITVEANPETVSPAYLREIVCAGVNRVSIGAQDFADKGLAALGRNHTVDQVVAAYDAARAAKVPNVNLDLIYGWPGQSPEEWMKSLETAVSLEPDHISCYELTLEDCTAMAGEVAAGQVVLPSEREVYAMTEFVEEFLQEAGYEQYEISNFCKPGMECRHNINYWENGAYLGMGAGAVSFVPPKRFENTEKLSRFIELIFGGKRASMYAETLGPEARFREAVILALRMNRGIELRKFRLRWGYDLMLYYGDRVSEMIGAGFLNLTGGRLYLTRQGRRVANSVLSRLV